MMRLIRNLNSIFRLGRNAEWLQRRSDRERRVDRSLDNSLRFAELRALVERLAVHVEAHEKRLRALEGRTVRMRAGASVNDD